MPAQLQPAANFGMQGEQDAVARLIQDECRGGQVPHAATARHGVVKGPQVHQVGISKFNLGGVVVLPLPQNL